MNPKSATHFRLTAAISVVSAHKWHSGTQKYQPTNKAYNAIGATIHSSMLLCKIDHPEINLELIAPKKIHKKVAISVWLGIQFGKEENNFNKPFLNTKAMECIAIL